MNCLTLGELGWLDREPDALQYLIAGEAKYAYYFPCKYIRGLSSESEWDLIELCVAVAGNSALCAKNARAIEFGSVLLISKNDLDELHGEIREILDSRTLAAANLDLLRKNLNIVSLYGLHFALLDEFGHESELFTALLALIERIHPILVALDYIGAQACNSQYATQFMIALEKIASLGPAVVINTKQNLDRYGLQKEEE